VKVVAFSLSQANQPLNDPPVSWVMTKERPPWTARLRANYHKRPSTKELVELLERAQMEVEGLWEVIIPDAGMTKNCEFPGCNYQRYPASRFCMYHVTGNTTYAAKVRASIRRDIKSGVDVSEYEGVFRLVTESIIKKR